MKLFAAILAGTEALFVSTVAAQAVQLDWVQVGDVGNAGELSGVGAGGYGHDRICGAVDYAYSISRYEVTNGQYREFLHAVARYGDPHGLYNTTGQVGGMAGRYGGIGRIGAGSVDDPFVYIPKGGDGSWDSKPVNFVSWYDALRFVNWIHNGQPEGTQDRSTTEDGAYDMSLGEAVIRKPEAQIWLPSEDEWYKAAYYEEDGASAGYWEYAVQSNIVPTSQAPPGDTGAANYYDANFAVGGPYFSTDIGGYALSDSAYGTFDQNGNLAEWNEAQIGRSRGLRGGSWANSASHLSAPYRNYQFPTSEFSFVGFRPARPAGTPEPATVIMLALGALVFVRRMRH